MSMLDRLEVLIDREPGQSWTTVAVAKDELRKLIAVARAVQRHHPTSTPKSRINCDVCAALTALEEDE